MSSGPPRRHDYDVQSMESNLASPRASVARNPIPPPAVSVRSEFPTLTRSRQQQTLTCLVTIEVPDNKWRPDPDDLRTAPPVPTLRPEDTYARPPSPAQSAPRFYPYESQEVLEEMTRSLRSRVENWHGLDFSRYVPILILLKLQLTLCQVRQVAPLWYDQGWKRPVIVAGAGVLPLRGDAYLRQGKEDANASTTATATAVGECSQEEYSMYPQGFHLDQEAPQRSHRDGRKGTQPE